MSPSDGIIRPIRLMKLAGIALIGAGVLVAVASRESNADFRASSTIRNAAAVPGARSGASSGRSEVPGAAGAVPGGRVGVSGEAGAAGAAAVANEARPEAVAPAGPPAALKSHLGSATALWSGDPVDPTADAPVAIEAHGIDMAALVVPTGPDPLSGSVLVPPDVKVAGWYRYSQPPGSSEGTTVIVGHVDFNGRRGPFFSMSDLKVGTTISVTRTDGVKVDYSVDSVEKVAKADLQGLGLFRTDGTHKLILISCGGEFDASARSYRDNIVTVATPI